MINIIKKLETDYNLFCLNNPETTLFFISNIDFLIDNFPYFKDLSLVTSILCSDNKKFNSRFYTRMTKFVEIIKYDSESNSNLRKNENIKSERNNKDESSIKSNIKSESSVDESSVKSENSRKSITGVKMCKSWWKWFLQ